MKNIIEQHLTLIICLLLIAVTVAVYHQVLGFDFTNYDDPKYITENPNVQQGLTFQGIRWAFTSMHASNWHPLTWLSLMVDYHLFGPNPGAFHLTNLLLHIANTLLLFVFLWRCTQDFWPSAFVAALFSLHPLHVESVAWIVERKDVLSTFFWMMTMLAYLHYLELPTVRRYLLVGLFLSLGLMAKPMLVTLPCALLLLDYWPLGRMKFTRPHADVSRKENGRLGIGNRKPLSFLLLEKIPLFILAAASSMLTLIAQKSSGTVAIMKLFPLEERIANALVSYTSYIVKMFWPCRLAIFYPHPGQNLPASRVLIAAIFLLWASVYLIWQGHRRRYLVTGWLWYIGTLIPVIGLVQVGAQAMADRYTYIPLTGLFIIVVWAARDLTAKWQYQRIVSALLFLAVIIVLMICTWFQIERWQNSKTLFEHALSVTFNNYVAHNNLGIALAEQGNIEEAMENFNATLKIRPNDIDARYNLGKALSQQGRIEQAIEHYNYVLSRKPDDVDAHNSLGLALAEQGKLEQAIAIYRSGLEINPRAAPLHSSLGRIFFQQGKLDEAFYEFEAALRLHPDSNAHNHVGLLLALKGRHNEAINYYNKAIRMDPTNAQAHYNLANSLLARGRLNESIAKYKKAIDLEPAYIKAHANLAIALAQTGNLDEAIVRFRKVVQLDPNSADAHFNLASALLDKGELQQALEEYQLLLRLEPQDSDTLCIIADILTEQGKVAEAVLKYREALRINPKSAKAKKGLKKALQKRNRSNTPVKVK